MNDLLPPNSAPIERNLARAASRLGDIPTPLRSVMSPDDIPAEQLPWLAWHLGIEAWKSYWPEQVRRARVKAAIPIARQNGTAAAVREVVATFGADIALREWWQMVPRGRPGTFDVVLTLNGSDGQAASADFVADIVAEIDRAKPVRAHYTFTQGFEQSGVVAIAAAARMMLYTRLILSDT